MKTEISRDSHQPKKCYSGVYQQQGRMLTDADWNELVDILKERLNDALKDVVGCKEGGIGGTPRHRPLKVIIDSDDNDKLTIQPGHVYVDGVAAQIPGEAVISYDAQPDFPSPPNPSGDYVLYADVWERTVTHLMDEWLRDKGLHGADTCTRKQTMCQVKWCSFVEGGPDNIDPEQSDKNPSKGNARLSVGLLNKSAHPDPCDPCADQIEVDSKVGNYLFRVEVHDVEGDADKTIKITLKWSSENGAEQFEAKDKNDMPASFLTGNWVYEFFNDTSEKHLGVHLASGVGFPVRDNLLHEGYPESPLPDGFDFVRRWDGYATFEWVGTEWQLTAGKDKDKGEGLSVASSSTIADQVVNLDSVELKLRLLSRVVSGLVTDAALITGDLIINTRPIDASGAGDDGVSTVKKASSAIAKAAAINAGSGDTKVWAIVNPNVVEGVAPSAFIAGTDDFGTGDLKINNISVDAVSAAGDQSAQAKAVVEVINKAFPGKKVVASETDDVVRLVAADGRNIDIELSGRASEARCGFSKGTYYSTITLASRSAIDIEGVHPEHAGLVKGTTPAVQFVAGDYWLADVREAEHEAGDPLITNETPQGIVHHYLTIGTVKGVVLQPNPEADRKYAFPPLTEMTRMFHVGGDGQEAMPDHSVPQPLKVGVTNGEWPVAGARVEFRVATGGGLLGAHSDFSLDVNAADQSGVTTTDEKGMAKCLWRLGSEGSTPLEKTEQRKQKLIVRLLNPNYDPSDSKSEKYLDHPPVQFYANLSTADQVAYVNPVCTDSPSVNSLLQSDSNDHGVFSWPDLDKDGDVTVKDVLDALLCKLRAKHIPYDVTGSNSARWADVNEEEVAKPPDTVQEAIDALLENLHSEDIKYPLPDCSPDTNTLKKYLQSYIKHKPGDATDRFRIKALWDALLCHLNAAKLPYDSTKTLHRWGDINEEIYNDLTHTGSWHFGANNAFLRGLSTDPHGNMLITGGFRGTLDFGGESNALTSATDDDVFVAKLDPYGKGLWAKHFRGGGLDVGQKIIADVDGNTVVTGSFSGEIDFGDGKDAIPSQGKSDVFVAKFSKDGEIVWAKQFGGSGVDIGYDVALDQHGNIILTGFFQGTINFGGDAMDSAGRYDIFLLKLNGDGDYQWSHHFGGTGFDIGHSIAVDHRDNIILAGVYQNSLDFGGGSKALHSAGKSDMFLAKFDSEGTCIWANSFGGERSDYARCVVVDQEDNIFLTGYFQKSINFGGQTHVLRSKAGYDLFAAKFNSKGIPVWAKSFGGTSADYGHAIAVDAIGNVILSGHFSGQANFGDDILDSGGDINTYLAALTPDGTHFLSKAFRGQGPDFGRNLTVDSHGNIILGGFFQGTLNLGGDEDLHSAGANDIFIAKFNPLRRPNTVQEAIDDLVNNLESSDIRYTFRDNCDDTAYGVRSLNSYVREDLGKTAPNSTTKIKDLWDKLLCLLDANRIPYNPTLKGARWRDIEEIGHLGISWSVEEETPGMPIGSKLIKDGSGNVIAAASSFVIGRSSSAALTEKYFSILVKLDDAGQIVWKKEFNALIGGLGVQSDGNIIIAGSFRDELDLGGDTPLLSSTGKSDIYVAKLDVDGEAFWNVQFGAAETEILTGLGIDSDDAIYLTGYFRETVNFGGSDLIAAADQDIFIAKLNVDGDHDWSDNYATSGDVKYAQLQVDQKDNIILTGSFSGELNFGGDTLTSTSPSTENIFLAKLDGNGTHQWSYKVGGDNDSGGSAVAIDDEENLLLCGYMDTGKPPFSNKTAFIGKFTDNGSDITEQWWKMFASTDSNAIAIATDADNNIVFGGNFSGAINFGGGEINAAEGADAFIARLDSNGNYLWANRFSVGQNVEVSRSIVLDNDGYPTFAWQLAKSPAFPNDSTLNHITKLNWEMRAAPATVQEALDDLVENLESSDINYRLPVCAGTKDSVRRRLFSLSGLADNTALKINNLFNALLCELDASSIPFDRNTDTGSLIDVFLNKERAQTITGPLTIGDGASTLSTEILLDVKGTVKAAAFVGDGSQLTGKWLDASGGDIYYKSGQVGIGTHDPSFTLEVVKEPPSDNINPVAIFRSTGRSSSAGAIRFQNTKNKYFNIGITNDHDFAISKLNKNISMRDDYLRITSGGKVGIGTTSPSHDLHTNGTSYAMKREGGGIDYAEYFESLNRKKVPVGTSIVFEKGKIRKAKKDEIPFGVISANPIIAGGVHAEWPKKYLRDEFGCLIMEEYQEEIMAPKREKVKKERQKTNIKTIEEEVIRTEIIFEKGKYCKKEFTDTVTQKIEEPIFEEVDLYDADGKMKIGKHQVPVMETYEEEIEVLDDEGNPVLVGTGKFETKERPKLNPDYDESKEYVPREQRPEWNCVGLLGQLYLRKGQAVAPTWVKIKDISDEVELWLVK